MLILKLFNFTKEKDGTIKGLDKKALQECKDCLRPAKYALAIIEIGKVNTSTFYRTVVLNWAQEIIANTGDYKSTDDIHKMFKKDCNGNESTSRMTHLEWNRFFNLINCKMVDDYQATIPFKGEYINRKTLKEKHYDSDTSSSKKSKC